MRSSRLTVVASVGLLMAAGLTAYAPADPAPTTGPDSVGSDVQITIDTKEAPELADWAENKLKPALREWYPKICAEIPVADHTPPKSFKVVFRKPGKGVAWTSGTHVEANADWIDKNLDGESLGAIVHEEVHVVQQPSHVLHGHHMPGWLLEGSCDYIRWFQYEPEKLRPKFKAKDAKYDAAYRPTAAFLQWVITNYDKNIVTEMNAANYLGTYSEDLWKQHTGHTAAELGAEWKASLEKKQP